MAANKPAKKTAKKAAKKAAPKKPAAKNPQTPWRPGPGQWGKSPYPATPAPKPWQPGPGQWGQSPYPKPPTPPPTGGGPTAPPPGPGGTPTPTPPAVPLPPETVDFFALAQGMFPHLPRPMLQALADYWDEVGDGGLALGLLRANRKDLYDKYMPGIYRQDGTFRMSEVEYFETKAGYAETLRDFGYDPTRFESRFVELFEGEKSAVEFRDDLGALTAGVLRQADQIRAAYVEEFGAQAQTVWDLSDEALVLAHLDRGLGSEVMARNIDIAQVRGNAAVFGFQRDRGRAESLLNAGLQGQQAHQFYGEAARAVPTFQTLSARYMDTTDPFDLTDFEDAMVFLNPEDRRQAESLLAQERASFTQVGGYARSGDGAVTGLRQR